MSRSGALSAVEVTAVLLFFLQATRGLSSGMFGVLYDAFFSHEGLYLAMVSAALLLLFCLLPAIFPAKPLRSPLALFVTATVVYASRIFLLPNHHRITLVSCLLTFGAVGLYIRASLRRPESAFPKAVMTAIVVDMLFRIAGKTYDLTLRQSWVSYQIVISIGLALLSLALFRTRASAKSVEGKHTFAISIGLSFGAFLFLETSFLAMPNAVARWSAADYSYVVPTSLLAVLLPLLLSNGQTTPSPGRCAMGRARLLIMASATGGIALGHLTHGGVALIGLVLAQGSVVTAFLSGFRGRDVERKSRHIGWLVSFGLLTFAALSFAHAFTFTYAYIGLRFFQWLGLPIFLLAAAIATFPKRNKQRIVGKRSLLQSRFTAPRVVISLGIALLGTIPALPPRKGREATNRVIRVGTYNIHYGYDGDWQYRLADMAKTIEASGADIVFLQEVDACRITSYGVDDAMWLARKLKMNVVYQPTMEYLTGIATLSRFPIVTHEAKLLPSRDEQTAILLVQVRIGNELLNTYGTWLGLTPSERERQLRAALEFIGERPGVLGGDMNVTVNTTETAENWQDSWAYRELIDHDFRDPFVESHYHIKHFFGKLPAALTEPAKKPNSRLDYIWIRGVATCVVDSRVLPSTASDHRMVVVDLGFE